MSETRKIAAILVSDVVGYSRLAGADEERILARLRALRSDLIDPTISVHHGRIVKRTGDGSIIEFNSVVDAVRCAIEVQRAMVERNAGVAPDNRIAFRIGIHLGDIVEESDGDLMGDGVNIAARLEGLCEAGGVCLSEDAHRQVRDRLKENFVDLGERQLKNIARPVRAYALPATAIIGSKDQGPRATRLSALRGGSRWIGVIAACVAALLAVGAFAWRAGYAPRFMASSVDDKLANAPRLSIVVLPFENLSGDKEQDYFADGITDDLTTDLSHLPDSFVISRGTAFTFKGKPVDAKEIGRELGVRYLLEGSVRRLGEKVEINAQLISTETGARVWADWFDGERSKIGELQVDVVARLANSLGVELVKAEALRATRQRPGNPDAVDLAMQGWAAFYSRAGPAYLNDSIALFERALALDPQQRRRPCKWKLLEHVSRPQRRRLHGSRKGAAVEPARSVRVGLARLHLSPARASRAMGAGDRFVRQVDRQQPSKLVLAGRLDRRQRLGRPRQRGEGGRHPVAGGLSRLHRADLGRNLLHRRSDLQRAISTHRRGPAQGGRAGGREEDKPERARHCPACVEDYRRLGRAEGPL
jgi:adenylate cyclase